MNQLEPMKDKERNPYEKRLGLAFHQGWRVHMGPHSIGTMLETIKGVYYLVDAYGFDLAETYTSSDEAVEALEAKYILDHNGDLPPLPGEERAASIGKQLKIARVAAGLSQAQLAERSGVHANTISAIERGTTDGRVSTLEDLAAACNVRLATILSRAY